MLVDMYNYDTSAMESLDPKVGTAIELEAFVPGILRDVYWTMVSDETLPYLALNVILGEYRLILDRILKDLGEKKQ